VDGIRHKLFGNGYVSTLREQFGIKNTVEMPILKDLSRYSDAGVPYSIVLPDTHKDLD